MGTDSQHLPLIYQKHSVILDEEWSSGTVPKTYKLYTAPKNSLSLGHSSFLPVRTFEARYSIFIFALHNSKMVPILR